MKIKIKQSLFVFVGSIFVIIGVLKEEHILVMSKAVMICLECIGIG